MPKLKFITIENLLEMTDQKLKFKLVETLSGESYKEGHIPGAISVPIPKYMTHSHVGKLAKGKGLKKSDTIIVYCASYTCRGSTRAGHLLIKAGFKNVLDFKGSKKLWVETGFELEK